MPSILFRAREWMADRFPSAQYPTPRIARHRFRLRDLSRKQRWWVAFAVFWGSLIALSIYGNLMA
jgi:hypothetical protein